MNKGAALVGMGACVVAGLADLGLLNLVLVPSALAVEGAPATAAARPAATEPSSPPERTDRGDDKEPTPPSGQPEVDPTNARVATATTGAAEVPLAPPVPADSPTPATEPAPTETPAAPAVASPQPLPTPPEDAGDRRQEQEPAEPSSSARTTTELVILFDIGDNNLTPEARAQMRDLAAQLHNDASAEVYLEGHADPTGTNEVNSELARARVETVAAYLERKSISRSRMSLASFGEERLAAVGWTARALQLNRRVLVRVTRGKQ